MTTMTIMATPQIPLLELLVHAALTLVSTLCLHRGPTSIVYDVNEEALVPLR